MKTGKYKSWREKLEKDREAKLVDIPPKMIDRFGPGKMLIARPLDVDAIICTVGKGELVTQSRIREKLAMDYQADVTCPITTGIFLRIVAETAEEDLLTGRPDITPYWRVVRDDGSLIEKFPGAPHTQTDYLQKEGHTILPGKGKKPPKVKDFEKYLVEL